ncbi:MAG: hypothetical protein R2747_13455 [Pyrinomonadaceae bacterium]
MIRKPLLLVSLILVLSLTAMAQNTDVFKNLAGPADEMDSMRLPDARTLGVRSKAAMLPIRFHEGRSTLEFPVETSAELRLSLLAPGGGDWQIIASNEKDKGIDLRRNEELVERSDGEIGLDGVRFPAEVFGFDHVRAGDWRVEISAPKGANLREGETAGYLVVSTGSPYQIYTYLDTDQTLVGRDLTLYTSVFDHSADADSVSVPTAVGGVIKRAEGEIFLPGGAARKLSFEPNGDALFGGTFTPQTAGQYRIQITVEGITPKGERFIRTGEHLIRVLGDQVRFGRSAHTELLDDTRMRIDLPISGLRQGRKVIVYGEVWAKNDDDTETPVAWIGGMSVAERRGLPVILDGRWLTRSGAKDGFELRNVRVQDADYFVPLAKTGGINLIVTAVPENARNFSGEISEEMRMGKRPPMPAKNDAAGGRLMLVHGYCSGGNPFPTSQFTGEIVFSDPNQNRTHDQFANLIRNFGAAYPSFGIVAHSQGGAASLHLYTYYWSGLDYATGGSRLIQSVGTPYQGTALAGNLAALGSVFGAGCGTNYDLTYSGASAWLSGIPSWARAKVHYYTTSFKDVWWRWDYCNIATDLFLNDPDDGVIEKSKGQLSGAFNRGHKTGWCHTSGMRDPAQTSDSSRNAEMNANAAR